MHTMSLQACALKRQLNKPFSAAAKRSSLDICFLYFFLNLVAGESPTKHSAEENGPVPSRLRHDLLGRDRPPHVLEGENGAGLVGNLLFVSETCFCAIPEPIPTEAP
jgi:hypothetical protein